MPMIRPVKQLLPLLLVLLFAVSPALAQSAQIEGEIELDEALLAQIFPLDTALLASLKGDFSAQTDASGLHAKWENGFSISSNTQPDGTQLLAVGDMLTEGRAFHLPAQTLHDPLQRIHAWLDQQTGEKKSTSAVYSSLFTRALSINLTGRMLAPVLAEVINQYPFLTRLPGMADAEQLSTTQTDDVWGNITRYKGDEKQYPDLSLIVLSLHLPALPNLYLWLRTDEFGSTLKFAVEEKNVTDWDETLLVLEEGKSDTGFIIKGFTLTFEDEEELNLYYEATLTTPAHALTVECDYYLDRTHEYLWAVEMEAHEATLGDVMEVEMEATELGGDASIPDLHAFTVEAF